MKVHSSLYDDYIYTGKGNSSFAVYSTNADTAFIRKAGQTTEFTLLNGSSLKEGSANLVTLSKKVDYFTFKQEGNTIKFKIKGQNVGDIYLYNIDPKSIKRDRLPYSNWILQNNNTVLKISTDLSEHEFEIVTADSLKIIPVPNQTVNEGSLLTFPVNASYTGTGTVYFSAANLPRNASFDAGKHTFTWRPVIGEVGRYEPIFSVSDGTLRDNETIVITVTRMTDKIGQYQRRYMASGL